MDAWWTLAAPIEQGVGANDVMFSNKHHDDDPVLDSLGSIEIRCPLLSRHFRTVSIADNIPSLDVK